MAVFPAVAAKVHGTDAMLQTAATEPYPRTTESAESATHAALTQRLAAYSDQCMQCHLSPP
jgi:hypothetical protein